MFLRSLLKRPATLVMMFVVAACETLSAPTLRQPHPSFDYNNSTYNPVVGTVLEGGQGNGGLSAWTSAQDGPNGLQAIYLSVHGTITLYGTCAAGEGWTVVRDSTTGAQSYFFMDDTMSHSTGDGTGSQFREARWQYGAWVNDGTSTQAAAHRSFNLGNCPDANGGAYSTHDASGPGGSFEVSTSTSYR
jgi:hypothetical protein